jgi:hypothetical protein
VDDGADCYDHSDLAGDPLVRKVRTTYGKLTEEIRIRDKDGRSDVQESSAVRNRRGALFCVVRKRLTKKDIDY